VNPADGCLENNPETGLWAGEEQSYLGPKEIVPDPVTEICFCSPGVYEQ